MNRMGESPRPVNAASRRGCVYTLPTLDECLESFLRTLTSLAGNALLNGPVMRNSICGAGGAYAVVLDSAQVLAQIFGDRPMMKMTAIATALTLAFTTAGSAQMAVILGAAGAGSAGSTGFATTVGSLAGLGSLGTGLSVGTTGAVAATTPIVTTIIAEEGAAGAAGTTSGTISGN